MPAGRQCRAVQQYVYEWIPRQTYETEADFRADLRAYLDGRMREADGAAEGDQTVAVEPVTDTAMVDLALGDEVGIAIELDFASADAHLLAGQLPVDTGAYSCVLVVACGVADGDAWRSLRADHETDAGGDGSVVHFIHKKADQFGGNGTDGGGPDDGTGPDRPE